MIDLTVPWQFVAFVEAPAMATMFGFIMRNAKRLGDLRVELAEYNARTAERYLPIEAQNAFEREIVRRLERIEDKLDRVASASVASP